MKKQWILIVALAALLIVAVIFATRSFPDAGLLPSDTTQASGSGSSDDLLDISFPTISYEEYQSMSGDERQAYYEKFPSHDVFSDWLRAARAAYEADRATIATIDGDGPIDIGDLIGGDKDE